MLESFNLGKNTGKNAGIEIKVFSKGTGGSRGSQLGTIRIGQGSFAWWTKSKRKSSTGGGIAPSLKLDWESFAKKMDEMSKV